MYLIDKDKNAISRLDEKGFGELGFKERENLQEWLADNPEALGEELLIIQKEFAGFSGTKERLDLLALDKQGDLVVIENKLDDTGRDAVWQVLKYASYKASRIKHEKDGVSISDREDWPPMIEFMVDAMLRMEEALRKPLEEIKLC